MLVLGISDLGHDTAAALLEGDRPLAAIEEDKLSRSAAVGGIPRLAIDYCLREASSQASELEIAAVATRPKVSWVRSEALQLRTLGLRLASHRAEARDNVWWKLRQVRLLKRSLKPGTPLMSLEHHLCHAASAFYPSEFDRALVLTLDESGDMWSGLIALGEGTNLQLLRPLRFPNSLGWFYTRVTELLGFRAGRDEDKVQWLSKEGSPEFLPVFRRLFSTNSDGLPALNLRFAGNGIPSAFSAEICRELRISPASPPRDSALGAAIARSAQDLLEEMVINLAECYRRKTNTKYLCVAGGVFLNVLLVHALEKRAGFEKVFVQPVSGNPGSALGAAYLARKRQEPKARRQPLSHLYLGPKFEESEIKAVLDNCKTIYRYLPGESRIVEETVKLLQQHKIVAWYQGRLEFGHRALGNRSILASAFSPFVMENLNKYVKHREDFHPFALSVPADHAGDFFECTDNCRFMATIGKLKESAGDLERFGFNGRTVRVHTVEKEVNPRFWALLRKFGEGAPAPVLLNTSFNLFGEPLVCDPREAIRSFYCSGIDSIVIGNFLVIKP